MHTFTRGFASLLLVLALVLMIAPGGPAQAAPPAGVAVATDFVNVRTAPSTGAAIRDVLEPGDRFTVVDTVAGEEVLNGNNTWFKSARGNYVYSGYATGSSGQPAGPGGGPSGRWIDVNRSTLVAQAIENGVVVYTAPITVGRSGTETPVGTVPIKRRVFDETMDSRTIGIPLSSPDGYYLENVLYTQYFTDEGAALHYNWWAPEAIGNYPTSPGCVGLGLADSEFFWNFAKIGTPVVIHD